MTPLAFTLENAIEIVPDEKRRILASEARKFADNGNRARRHWRKSATLWEYALVEHERLVWMDAYFKRKARLARMKRVQS